MLQGPEGPSTNDFREKSYDITTQGLNQMVEQWNSVSKSIESNEFNSRKLIGTFVCLDNTVNSYGEKGLFS